jgi:glycosyltransferase involved in cell wall biosynthesis/polysaccharide pyruvyl transferase WcaK-like protein
MRRDLPDSLVVFQRLRDLHERLGDVAARDETERDIARIRAARVELAASDSADRKPQCLIVDPIFRGSRLYYSAMLAEAMDGVTAGDVQLLTRRDVESDLLPCYSDRLAHAAIAPVLSVPSKLWYGQVDVDVCREIVARMTALPAGSVVVFSGFNEVMPALFEAIAAIDKRLPIHVCGYEYAVSTLHQPSKREGLASLAAKVESLTLWVLDESFDGAALNIAGVAVVVMADPVPHLDASQVLAQGRAEVSDFIVRNRSQGELALLAVGLQSARKGLRDILRAGRTLLDQKVPARIYLSGQVAPGEENLAPQVRALSGMLAVRTEYVSDAEILRTYNACDAVLLPYARDFSGSSGVFAHAMALGKPVITTSHGCVGWRTRKFGVGLTYDANDPAGLVAAVKTMQSWSDVEWRRFKDNCDAYYRRNSYDVTLEAIRRQVVERIARERVHALPAVARTPMPDEGDRYAFSLQAVESIRQICLMDTGIGSRNMGDHIIVDSIKRHLRELFPDAIFVTVPTHEYLGPESLKLLDSSAVRLVCGTNLLASHMDEYKQWKLGGLEFAALRDVTLLGTGWWQYQEAPNRYTELLLNRILSNSSIHSVRDSYSVEKLSRLSGKTVINTTCPTLWSLTPEHLRTIPDRVARDVVTTLTDYKADPVADGYLLEHLAKRYRHVYVWIQGTGDFSYLKRLAAAAPDKVRVVPATLEAYDRLLSSSLDLDYVGTRLHAGVRALQKSRRALILAVDNRAREISADTNLPCLPRERATSELEGLIGTFSARNIRLPMNNINRWLAQFR